MVDAPIDVAQARKLLLAIGVPAEGLEVALPFDDLLDRIQASPRLAVQDWRGEITEGLAAIASVVGAWGYGLAYEADEDQVRALLTYRGETARVKYVPAE